MALLPAEKKLLRRMIRDGIFISSDAPDEDACYDLVAAFSDATVRQHIANYKADVNAKIERMKKDLQDQVAILDAKKVL